MIICNNCKYKFDFICHAPELSKKYINFVDGKEYTIGDTLIANKNFDCKYYKEANIFKKILNRL